MSPPDDRDPRTRGSRRPLGRGPGMVPPRAHATADAPEASGRTEVPSQDEQRPVAHGDGPPAAAAVPSDEPTNAAVGNAVEGPLLPRPAEDAARAATAPPVDGADAAGTEKPDGAGTAHQTLPEAVAPEHAAVGHGAPRDVQAADGESAADLADGEPETPVVGESAEAGSAETAEDDGRFTVRLDNFEGPFDLLLQLISKHKLDVTEVALSKVTDEFMAHIHAMGPDWDLDQTTEFLVVAATLLDLKAARLLPAAEVEDEADLALLEARDLLFARLLQYRAYKRVADIFAERLADEARRHPRTVGLEPHHAELLPEVALSIGPEGFAQLAVKAMQPKPKPQVYVEHIHAPLVSVREQAEVVVTRLRELGEAAFSDLISDAPDTLTVVARFLALLELYRERAVTLDQPEALGDLTVRWTGGEATGPLVTDEFDQGPQPLDQQEKEPQP